MATYNERFAIGVEDFLRPAQYDRLAAEIDKQGVLNAANQFNSLGRIQSAVMNGEYNVFATKETGQQQVGNATAGMWTDIGTGALKGAGGFISNGGLNLGKSYGGTGSTGGPGDTVKWGDTSKYGDAFIPPDMDPNMLSRYPDTDWSTGIVP